MTIKTIAFIENITADYISILNCLLKVSNLEITNFVYSENSPINIDGLIQCNGSLLNAMQHMKCETVIVFVLSDLFVDVLLKMSSSDFRVSVILVPMSINISSLVRLNDCNNVTLFTCLPLRHLNRCWKAHNLITKNDCILQYIEGSLVAPTLSNRYRSNGCRTEINMNHFYRLVMVDVIQFISNRTVFKVQAVSRAVEWESRDEHKNEKHLDDYSIIIGHFKVKEGDVKSSLTSKSGAYVLTPRTTLIKINTSFTENEKVSLKLKIKSSNGTTKIDNEVKNNDNGKRNGDENKGRMELFWNSKMVMEGVETFVKHVEYVRQQSAPRLVDLGTLSEEDVTVAKRSLITVPDLVMLCNVVCTVDRASLSGQTVIM